MVTGNDKTGLEIVNSVLRKVGRYKYSQTLVQDNLELMLYK